MTRNLTKQFPSGAVAKRKATANSLQKGARHRLFIIRRPPSRRPDRKIIQKPRTVKLSPRKSRPDVAVQRPEQPIGPTRSRTSDLHISAAFLSPRQKYEGTRIRTAYPPVRKPAPGSRNSRIIPFIHRPFIRQSIASGTHPALPPGRCPGERPAGIPSYFPPEDIPDGSHIPYHRFEPTKRTESPPLQKGRAVSCILPHAAHRCARNVPESENHTTPRHRSSIPYPSSARISFPKFAPVPSAAILPRRMYPAPAP